MNKAEIKRVLVVEDDVRQQQNLKKMIESMGENFSVLTAVSYESAMAICQRESVDLFLLDIDLATERNGYELAESIRLIPRYALTWIVFLTIKKQYEYDAFKKVHCYDYLIKPYSKDVVTQLINKLLNNQLVSLSQAKQSYIKVEIEHALIRINTDEIIFVEARGRGVEINTTRGIYKAQYFSLKKVITLLEPYPQFFKTYRSYLVNCTHVSQIKRITSRQYEITFINSDKKALLSSANKDRLEQML